MVIIKSTNDAPTTSDRFDAKRANELIEPSIWEAPKKDEIKNIYSRLICGDSSAVGSNHLHNYQKLIKLGGEGPG